MPIKPLFERAPLTSLREAALRPGQFTVQHPVKAALHKSAESFLTEMGTCADWSEDQGRLLCGCIRLFAAEGLPAAAERLLPALHRCEAFPEELPASLAVACAAMAAYEWTADVGYLQTVAGWLNAHAAEELTACGAIRENPADLLELLRTYYLVTGKKAALRLWEALRSGCADWATTLAVFNEQRPCSKANPDGLEHLPRRQQLSWSAESLADGIRATGLMSCFSGSRSENVAGRNGWGRIQRFHGLPIGGTTAAPMLEGRNPLQRVSTASVGAWLQCFAAAMLQGEDWADAEAENILRGAACGCFAGDDLLDGQQANQEQQEHRRADLHGTVRLLNGLGQAASAALTMRRDGAALHLTMEGSFRVPMGDGTAAFTLKREMADCACEQWIIQAQLSAAASGLLVINRPFWAGSMTVTAADGTEQRTAGSTVSLPLSAGGTIRISLARGLRTVFWYHQGTAAFLGGDPLRAQIGAEWALQGDPFIEDGQVKAQVRRILPEDLRRGDVPVRPRTEGETRLVNLVPCAESAIGQTVLAQELEA